MVIARGGGNGASVEVNKVGGGELGTSAIVSTIKIKFKKEVNVTENVSSSDGFTIIITIIIIS